MIQRKKLWSDLILTGAVCFTLCACFSFAGCNLSSQGEKPAVQQTTRMSFDQLFEVNGNTVTPKAIIRFAGTTMTPAVPFDIQVMNVNNTPFSQYIGRDAEVKKVDDVYEIVSFY